MTKITHWAFLLALAATTPLIGQDYLIPVAASNGATCGAPPFAVVPQSAGFVSCGRGGYFHWTAVGGGWATSLVLSNPTGSDMAAQITLVGQDGSTPSPMTLVRNGVNLGVQSADTQLLAKHSSIRYELPSGGAATQANGQVVVQILAKNGLSLQSVQAIEDYTYTSTAGVVFSTVTLPIAWIDQAQAAYTASFEESTSTASLGAFAIKDVSGSTSGQTVDVQAFDVTGKSLGDQKVTLAAGQVKAYTTDGLFGASTFQSLSGVPVARLEFTGADRIDVLMLQVRGQSLAAMPTTTVLTQ